VAVIACVGGGSNALGVFDGFVDDEQVRLIGVEAGGDGLVAGRHAARFATGTVGVLQGTRSLILQDANGNVDPTHSVSAGLDYASVGPEHAWLHDLGRAEYAWASDAQALDAFELVAQLEGLIPALESAHALAHAGEMAAKLSRDEVVLVNLSGRGDKDVEIAEAHGLGGRRGTLTSQEAKG
ncbi:MAG TPA: tryptophan synthase subunit beta, partial [Acidobacteria bacterium]|nr:tryptophan synthase subunit beta [Acidobacteriota bacterium]